MIAKRVLPSRVETLLRYSRYVAIIAEQLEATEVGDRERVMLLLDERRLIEAEIEATHDDESSDPASLDELLTSALAEVSEKIESARLDKDQWIQISSGALTSARSLSLRPAAAAGRYPEPVARGERLDLRF